MSRKTKKKPGPRIVDVDRQRLEELLRRAESQAFDPGDYATIRELLESYSYLTNAVGKKSTTIARLRELLFGTKSESRTDLQGLGDVVPPPDSPGVSNSDSDSSRPHVAPQDSSPCVGDSPKAPSQPPRKGHGRIAADDYVGATTVTITHPFLVKDAHCPECSTGKVYLTQPNVVVRISGQAPLVGTVHEMEKWRCGLCGEVFAAAPPVDLGDDKYDATSAAIIGVLKYGTGVPFHRLATMQGSLGVPVPPATQWKIVSEATESYVPVYETLLDLAAQGDVFHNDDTTMKILERMGKRARSVGVPTSAPEVDASSVVTEANENDMAEQLDNELTNGDPEDMACEAETECLTAERVDEPGSANPNDATVVTTVDTPEAEQPSIKPQKKRTGTNTSAVVSTCNGHEITAFFTGGQHAGENLADVLRRRVAETVPIQMCDGLSRNYPPEFATIVSNCLVHARRYFVKVYDQFPDPCAQVIDWLAEVYRIDGQARKQQLSPAERLAHHQRESQPVMVKMHAWLTQQFAERLVEPNSGLGEAITYMLRHWEKLTLFLREPGAPLDNNICERALKKA